MTSVASNYANNPLFAQSFAPTTAAMQAEISSILKPGTGAGRLRPAYFSDVSKLVFTLSTKTGDMAMGSYIQRTASGFLPDGTRQGGDVWLNPKYISPTAPGTYQNFVILHEIGHALGLEHGNNYPDGGFPSAPHLDPKYDSNKYTIMSYNKDPNVATGVYPIGLQQLDIAALQEMYGVNYGTRADNTMYSFGISKGPMTIWDGGGIDHIVATNFDTRVVIDLQPGHFSSIGGKKNIAMALVDHLPTSDQLRPLIEHANGGKGNDELVGNKANNTLMGGAGTNLIKGMEGNDILVSQGHLDILDGGSGNDWLWNQYMDGNTQYVFGSGDGHDGIVDLGAKPNNIDIVLKNLVPTDIQLHAKLYNNGATNYYSALT